ncbi:hypothetical protein [Marinilabilia sp.]
MKQSTDLTGFWRFREEFDDGEDFGEARLFQNGKHLTGHIAFKEQAHGEPPFYVRVSIKGKVEGMQISFSETSYIILSGPPETEYELEERTGLINALGQIVGSGEDKQGVHGVFVMDRIF